MSSVFIITARVELPAWFCEHLFIPNGFMVSPAKTFTFLCDASLVEESLL
jgi:hypothetical protein